jgi:asparagine synthase (glutamine-hydrolysing)
MCGIAGHVAFPSADALAVARMTAALTHRGPDGYGELTDGPVALGHTRLSIIDIDGGAQPMFNEDRSIAVIFNGEIYNYRELRDDLRSRHQLRTSSDTEVLVHLYEDLGEEMLHVLRGMFAFAIWDARSNRLFAARDPFGEKPLYYASTRDGLYFASELAALQRAGLDLGGIDRDALGDYLELLYIPAPRTIWRAVKKLPAGTFLSFDRSGLRTHRYYRPPLSGSSTGPPADVCTVQETLGEAAKLRLRSDVPVGVLLSGGLDSSTVVALVAPHTNKLRTFSVGFGDDTDEFPYARMVAERYGTEHHELLIRRDLVADVERAFDAYSEPFGDTSSVPSVAVYRQIGAHMKVVLTGDGGDELFAGYGRYRTVQHLPYVPGAVRVARLLDHITARRGAERACRALRLIGSRGAGRARSFMEVFSQVRRHALLGEHTSSYAFADGAGSAGDSAIAFDLNVYLPDDLLVKTDTAAMRSSVEARCPILDVELARTVVPEPLKRKQNRRMGKLLLRRVARNLLPPPLLQRSKSGFGSPVGPWLYGPLRQFCLDYLARDTAIIRGWLDGKAIDRVLREALAGRGNPYQAWSLLALEGWAARFYRSVAERPAPAVTPASASWRA